MALRQAGSLGDVPQAKRLTRPGERPQDFRGMEQRLDDRTNRSA